MTTTAMRSELMVTPPLAPVRLVGDEALRWRTVTIEATATVGEARGLLRETGQDVLVVTSDSRPVGIITKAELWALGVHAPRDDSLVEDLLRWELVESQADLDVERTLRRYRDAAWASLFRRRPGRRADRST